MSLSVSQKYKELKRSGTCLFKYTDPMNDRTVMEIWKIDGNGYRVTLYIDVPYIIEPEHNIDKYIPKFGEF